MVHYLKIWLLPKLLKDSIIKGSNPLFIIGEKAMEQK
jgi:hypothetical protein